MKSFTLLLILVFIACNKQPKLSPKKINSSREKEIIDPEINDTIILGDINNDTSIDTAFVFTPSTLTTLDKKGNVEFTNGCINNNCFNRIRFSCNLPEIIIENSVWGTVERVEDLNNDGISEILFSTSWFTTTISHLNLYSFDGKNWKTIQQISIRNNGNEILKNHLVKTNNNYYLEGITNSNGDEIAYKKKIKF